jgi:hypothetical protein
MKTIVEEGNSSRMLPQVVYPVQGVCHSPEPKRVVHFR